MTWASLESLASSLPQSKPEHLHHYRTLGLSVDECTVLREGDQKFPVYETGITAGGGTSYPEERWMRMDLRAVKLAGRVNEPLKGLIGLNVPWHTDSLNGRVRKASVDSA